MAAQFVSSSAFVGWNHDDGLDERLRNGAPRSRRIGRSLVTNAGLREIPGQVVAVAEDALAQRSSPLADHHPPRRRAGRLQRLGVGHSARRLPRLVEIDDLHGVVEASHHVLYTRRPGSKPDVAPRIERVEHACWTSAAMLAPITPRCRQLRMPSSRQHIVEVDVEMARGDDQMRAMPSRSTVRSPRARC